MSTKWRPKIRKFFPEVNTYQMPEGVEHFVCLKTELAMSQVNTYQMPEGVEHSILSDDFRALAP